jgi:5-methylcytosine-specific restriction endonuclease McrA
MRYDKEVDPFYRSTRWKKLREKILKRDNYQCQLSRRYGKLVQANTVHHIFPREKYPQYEYMPWNLISLCNKEHNKIHDRNTDDLTEYGKELLRRTALNNNIEVPKEYV